LIISRLHIAAVLGISLCALGTLQGCGLLVGNVRPVDEKSDDVDYLNITREFPDWKKLSAPPREIGDTQDPDTTDQFDVAFQRPTTSSVISLNSACRPSQKWGDTQNQEQQVLRLKEVTQQLLLGFSGVSNREERLTQLDGGLALETTMQGRMADRTVKIRAVVSRRGDCVYDLMYISRPDTFGTDEPAFARFVASLKLRR
jgi:hypothetical protein